MALVQKRVDPSSRWEQDWATENFDVQTLVTNELSKKIQVIIIRIRTGPKRRHIMFKWGLRDSKTCEFGYELQTTSLQVF